MISNSTPHTAASQPLFRPEVLSARAETHGEILLLRPLSLTLLCWTAAALASVAVCFFFLAHYTPVNMLPVSLRAIPGFTDNVAVNLPSSYGGSLATGNTLVLLCQSCAASGNAGRVQGKISGIEQNGDGQQLEIVISLSRPDLQTLFDATKFSSDKSWPPARLVAEIPLPRQPLYRWLFQPGPSKSAPVHASR